MHFLRLNALAKNYSKSICYSPRPVGLGFRSVVTRSKGVVLPRLRGPELFEIRQDARVPDLKPNEVIDRTRAVSFNPLDTLSVPSLPAYTDLLEASIVSKSFNLGRQVHQHLLKNSPTAASHPLILEKLARFYVACHRLQAARNLFDEIPDPSVVLCNWMIRAYSFNGPFRHALHLYSWMLAVGISPTKFTFPFVLKACSALRASKPGKGIHGHAIRIALDNDVYISTALLDFYMKCGSLEKAERVFDRMVWRDKVAWNAMVAGFSLHGQYNQALRLVREMSNFGINPNSSTLVGLLPVVAQAGKLKEGKAIHGYCIRRSFDASVLVSTGLLDMYGKCEQLSYAKIIFNMSFVRNEVTWSAMIGALVNSDRMREALELFKQVMVCDRKNLSVVILGCAVRACTKLMDLSRGSQIHRDILKSGNLADLMVGNTLVSMYAKCCAVDDAIKLFEEMNPRDRVSYSAMVSGFVQNGRAREALQLFRVMQLSKIAPDEATMLGILPACSQLAALKHGKCAHGYTTVNGFTDDVSICNALIDMYAKCGKVDTAREIFNRIPERDIVSWNCMIAGYGSHGLGKDALHLFQQLLAEDMKPDEITFIGLLIACSHSGLVNEGKHWFGAMVEKFSVTPRIDHYICMVDLLGRAGLLEEAKTFIEEMPFEPDIHVWAPLLAACRVHKNIKLGEEASDKIQRSGAQGPANFVLLSNIYSCAGRFEEAAVTRIRQRDEGFRKSPGCSWVEINGSIHAFVGGDRSHPKATEMYKKLEELLLKAREVGYGAVNGFVLHDVEEEEKEHILLYHSEKLAIAFAIISLSPGKPILVTKNLRVCGDCHEAIKFISLVEKREITVRDTVRFHHFKDGICSCKDFW